MPINQSTEMDDWSVYRRLVVDTLQRLDERTAELHQHQSTDSNRILLIERRMPDLDDVENSITNINKAIDNIVSERSTEKTIRKILLVVGGGAWTIFTILLTVWGKTLF